MHLVVCDGKWLLIPSLLLLLLLIYSLQRGLAECLPRLLTTA
jgi:hypothetical protein